MPQAGQPAAVVAWVALGKRFSISLTEAASRQEVERFMQDDQHSELASALDRLLSKYVTVWIWSILIGINSGITFSLASYSARGTWGPLTFLPLALTLIGIISAILSWVYLLNYLSRFIIPSFFLERREDPRHSRLLRLSVQAIIFAVGARLLVSVVDLLYASFGIRF